MILFSSLKSYFQFNFPTKFNPVSITLLLPLIYKVILHWFCENGSGSFKYLFFANWHNADLFIEGVGEIFQEEGMGMSSWVSRGFLQCQVKRSFFLALHEGSSAIAGSLRQCGSESQPILLLLIPYPQRLMRTCWGPAVMAIQQASQLTFALHQSPELSKPKLYTEVCQVSTEGSLFISWFQQCPQWCHNSHHVPHLHQLWLSCVQKVFSPQPSCHEHCVLQALSGLPALACQCPKGLFLFSQQLWTNSGLK